jgi:hypothetical protein
LRTAALLLDPVLADRASIVFSASPHHRPNRPIDEESAPDADNAKGNPEHGPIFADWLPRRNLTTIKGPGPVIPRVFGIFLATVSLHYAVFSTQSVFRVRRVWVLWAAASLGVSTRAR